MTLEQIKNSEKTFLTPNDIADILGANAQTIRIQAREAPEMLGFPVSCCGKRTRIPRGPFLRFLGYEEKKGGSDNDQ